MRWQSSRIAKAPPVTGADAPIGGLGGGVRLPVRRDPPGGGITLGRAIGRNLLQSTMAEGDRVTYTTAHTGRTYYGGELDGPHHFTRLTGQGSPHSDVNIEQTVTRIRLSRRALGRNRGRLEP